MTQRRHARLGNLDLNRLNPDHAPTFGRRGTLYERLGFVDQALADYRTMNGLGARPAWLEDKLGEYGLLE